MNGELDLWNAPVRVVVECCEVSRDFRIAQWRLAAITAHKLTLLAETYSEDQLTAAPETQRPTPTPLTGGHRVSL